MALEDFRNERPYRGRDGDMGVGLGVVVTGDGEGEGCEAGTDDEAMVEDLSPPFGPGVNLLKAEVEALDEEATGPVDDEPREVVA